MVMPIRRPSAEDELDNLFKEIDAQNKGRKQPSHGEILEEIQAHRTERADKGP
jgi:hypothetical protein